MFLDAHLSALATASRVGRDRGGRSGPTGPALTALWTNALITILLLLFVEL